VEKESVKQMHCHGLTRKEELAEAKELAMDEHGKDRSRDTEKTHTIN